MSRVIKSAVWQNEPKVVDRPECLVRQENDAAADTAARASLAAQLVLLAEKEERAKKMIAEAEVIRADIFAAAQAKAAEITQAAMADAENIAAEAAQTGQKSGYDEGYEAGFKAAQEEQREIIAAANAKAERTIATAQEEMKLCLLAAEQQIVEMTMRIVEKVLPQHFIDVPQVILPVVNKALEKVRDQNGIVIRVAPDNYEFVLMAKNEFQAMIDGNEMIQIVSDPSLAASDCVIDSLNGSVDARLATQLELIKKSIQEVME